jgi:RNA polymerase sigma factor (sigma-70 family)
MNVPPDSAIAYQRPRILPDIDFSHPQSPRNKLKVTCYSDKDVVEGLNARDFRVIRYLYKKYFREVCFIVTSNSGSRMDAEDIFQDVLIVLYKKISGGSLILTSSFNTYLFSICRHLWFQKLKNRLVKFESGELSGLDIGADEAELQELREKEELYVLYREHFSMLSDDDQKVLNLYLSKTPAKEIACIMGYKSDDYAKFRKYLCKEKLKNSIINDPRFQKFYRSA